MHQGPVAPLPLKILIPATGSVNKIVAICQ